MRYLKSAGYVGLSPLLFCVDTMSQVANMRSQVRPQGVSSPRLPWRRAA